MKLGRLGVLGAAAFLLAGPALAQWPPPPPPFVTNPQLAPPAARPMTPAEQRAQRRAERQRAEALRQAKSQVCHRQADAEHLRKKARRVFIRQCMTK